MGLRGAPFTDVRVVADAFPNAIALLDSLVPLSIIDFTVLPSVHAFAMGLAVLELTKVRVPVRIPLESFSISQIMFPESFVLAAISVLHDALTMALSLDDRSKEDSIFVFDFFEAIHLPDCCQVDLVGLQLNVVRVKGIKRWIDLARLTGVLHLLLLLL